MDLTKLKFQLVRYRFNALQLSVEGFDPFEVPKSQITGLYLEKNYEDEHYPFFVLSIVIPGYLYRAMRANPYKNTITMDLQAGYYNNAIINPSEQVTFISKINGKFLCYMNDVTPELDEEKQNQLSIDDGTYKVGYTYGDLANVDLLLYKQEYLDAGDKVVNQICNANLTDNIIYVCNQAGISKLRLSPPNNTKVYSEFSITPISAIEQLERICNSYGYHSKGSTIFYDFDCLYIVDKNPECTVFIKNEYKTTYLASLTQLRQDDVDKSGCFKDDINKYNVINLISDSISINDNYQIQDSNLMYIDAKTGSVSTIQGDNNKKPLSKTLISDKGDDTINAYSNAAKETGSILTVGMQYIDLSFLDVNKEFVFTTDVTKHQKYTGSYRISKYTCDFIIEGEYLSPIIMAEFRK